jgi:hypothetical protein
MEKGCQKSKRPSYKAKFKHGVVWCAEKTGTHKAAAILGADESSIQLWWKH